MSVDLFVELVNAPRIATPIEAVEESVEDALSSHHYHLHVDVLICALNYPDVRIRREAAAGLFDIVQSPHIRHRDRRAIRRAAERLSKTETDPATATWLFEIACG